MQEYLCKHDDLYMGRRLQVVSIWPCVIWIVYELRLRNAKEMRDQPFRILHTGIIWAGAAKMITLYICF